MIQVAFQYWYKDKMWKVTIPAHMQSARWRVWGPYFLIAHCLIAIQATLLQLTIYSILSAVCMLAMAVTAVCKDCCSVSDVFHILIPNTYFFLTTQFNLHFLLSLFRHVSQNDEKWLLGLSCWEGHETFSGGGGVVLYWPPCSAEVKNAWSLAASPSVKLWHCAQIKTTLPSLYMTLHEV